MSEADPRIAIPALSPAAFALRDAGGIVAALGGATMGTRWSLRFVTPGTGVGDLRPGIEKLLAEVVREMSAWEPDSDLSRFNRAAPGSWHTLPSGFFTVLEAVLDLALDSGGAFDPTVGALVDGWGFGPAPFAGAPNNDTVAALRDRCGWQGIELDHGSRRALQPGGVVIDLNGIAKGYAVDRVADLLRRRGIVHFLFEIGGEYIGEGLKPDGQPWWLDLEMPPGALLPPVRVALHGLAAATSGDYRRSFTENAQTFSHSIDPDTGRPIANGVASVTVLHQSCMWADAYATALTVMGERRGLAFATARNLPAYMVTRTPGGGLTEAMSPAFEALLN